MSTVFGEGWQQVCLGAWGEAGAGFGPSGECPGAGPPHPWSPGLPDASTQTLQPSLQASVVPLLLTHFLTMQAPELPDPWPLASTVTPA